MNDDDLLACTRELVRKSCATEAELLLHLAEIDERKLYAERAFSSMHVFCVKELGFSEGAAYNRIGVARAKASGSGPHAKAPEPSSGHLVRTGGFLDGGDCIDRSQRGGSGDSSRAARRHRAPFRGHLHGSFTAPRPLRDKLQQAKDLLRHRVPGGELAVVLDKALDALLEKLMKERFAVGARPRKQSTAARSAFPSRHIPAEIRRAVYQRAGGRCEFVDEKGRRCAETACLEYDHLDGFARTHVHSVDVVRLLCRGHNTHAAEQLYGRVYMERVRREIGEARAAAPGEAALPSVPVTARPGASPQGSLF